MFVFELEELEQLSETQEDQFWWYELDSPVELETRHIRIQTPPNILVFKGPYKRSSVQQLVFSGGNERQRNQFVCSIIQREHVENGMVVLEKVPFLSLEDTLKVYRRIVGKSYETVRTSDLDVIDDGYPWPDTRS